MKGIGIEDPLIIKLYLEKQNIVLDNKGEEVFSCAFAKNQRNICLFSNGEDYIKLSKRKWEKLTSPFLSIGSDKINWKNINDKVEWTELKGK